MNIKLKLIMSITLDVTTKPETVEEFTRSKTFYREEVLDVIMEGYYEEHIFIRFSDGSITNVPDYAYVIS